MKKAFITGGSGFAGQHLARELKSHGFEVYSFDRGHPVTDKSLFKHAFQGDLLKKRLLRKVITDLKPDAVFHLAAQASPGLSFEKPKLTFEVNVLGTVNLLKTIIDIRKNWAEYNPKIVIAASADIYGKVRSSQLPITEKIPFNPTNPYAVSKISVYFLSKVFVKAYGLKIVIAVPFNHSGPGQREGFFIPDMCVQIARIEKGRQRPEILTGNLDSKRDIVDVRDIVRGYRLMMEKGNDGEEYLMCSGKSWSMQELLDKLMGMSVVKVFHRYDESRMRPVDFPDIYGSFEKAKKHLGWEPRLRLENTLRDTLDWYRSLVV